MGWFSFLDPAIDTVMGPLLGLDPLYAVGTIAFIMTLILTLAYKFLTNQDLMKQLKAEIKALQAEMKELKEHPEKMMKVQKKAMETNMKYMMESFKPTLITFIPIILILGWMQGALAFEPIMPGEEFTLEATFTEGELAILKVLPTQGIKITTRVEQQIVENKARWGIRAEKGNYQLTVIQKDSKQSHEVTIDEQLYKDPLSTFSDNSITKLETSQKKLIVLNLFGWELGWLGAYIIVSIICSIVLRKVLKVH